jgi:RNA polymerase sigma-70 factor (ECF subfamily)
MSHSIDALEVRRIRVLDFQLARATTSEAVPAETRSFDDDQFSGGAVAKDIAADNTQEMRLLAIDAALVGQLYGRAKAERWGLTPELWAATLQASAGRAFVDRVPTPGELGRYLAALHLEDLAIACACAAGHDVAWEHFMREHRPVLYRSARAVDPSSARELADSLYAELYGMTDRGGARQSLFRYFHGRSRLATWLRAMLGQRYIDRIRADRRLEPLPDDDSSAAIPSSVEPANPERSRYLGLIERALTRAVETLQPRDRLRLGCYYAQGMTLASIGRLLSEHEATVSRHLTRTRRIIREEIERQLRVDGLAEADMAECFRCVVADAGPIDLSTMLRSDQDRKESGNDRSLKRETL